MMHGQNHIKYEVDVTKVIFITSTALVPPCATKFPIRFLYTIQNTNVPCQRSVSSTPTENT